MLTLPTSYEDPLIYGHTSKNDLGCVPMQNIAYACQQLGIIAMDFALKI